MWFFKISFYSLWNRKLSSFLSIFAIAMGVALLLGVQRMQEASRSSFENTISGTDLIVGARSGSINLLLYSVFRIGNATNNVSWDSFKQISSMEAVKWSIPISLGDSHKSYSVVGTNQDYYQFFQFSKNKKLSFLEGQQNTKLFEAVIGYEVAQKLKYKVGTQISLSHGGGMSFQDHSDMPFTVVGILNFTGTPVDRSVHISLEAMEVIHTGWENGAPPTASERAKIKIDEANVEIKNITAFFVGLKSRIAVFKVSRDINEYENEALSAVMPGKTLMEMWSIISIAEKAFFVIGLLVLFSSCITMLVALVSSLNERRREMAIFRALGARAYQIFLLLIFEASFLSLIGILSGIVLSFMSLYILKPFLELQTGLSISVAMFTWQDLKLLCLCFAISLLAALLPASQAYRNSLLDGITVKS